jgi:hypothetical protein
LALFWNMVQKMSKCLSRFYWGVVATCVISWMFAICVPFILCHYFGREAGRSVPRVGCALANNMASEMFHQCSVPAERCVDGLDHGVGYHH